MSIQEVCTEHEPCLIRAGALDSVEPGKPIKDIAEELLKKAVGQVDSLGRVGSAAEVDRSEEDDRRMDALRRWPRISECADRSTALCVLNSTRRLGPWREPYSESSHFFLKRKKRGGGGKERFFFSL